MKTKEIKKERKQERRKRARKKERKKAKKAKNGCFLCALEQTENCIA